MKTAKCTSIFLWILFFVLPVSLLAQVKEIPITTSNKEALKFFIDGRNKAENLEFVSAASLFDQAIKKDPEFAMAYLYRSQVGGGMASTIKNIDKAVSLADKVSEGEKLLIQYYKAGVDGDVEKQKQYLDQILTKFPSDKRAQQLAGEYYYNLYKYPEALVHLNKAVELDKNYVLAYNMIGYCQSAANNYPEADKAFQQYIKLSPKSANPYDSYGEFLLKTGKYDESITQYKKAIEIDPVNFAGSLIGVGNNYIFKGDYNMARKYYQDYYNKAPDDNGKMAAMYWKATSYVHEGDMDNAVKTFEERRTMAEKKKMTSVAVWSYAFQAELLVETGKPAEGLKFYQKAIDLAMKSDLPDISKNNFNIYSMLGNSFAYSALGDFDKAKAEIEKCKPIIEAKKNPGFEMMLSSMMGYYEFKKGEYDKAIQDISKADPEEPLNWYYTGLAYSKKGDKQNAAKYFEKVTKSNVNSLNLALVRKKAMEELKK